MIIKGPTFKILMLSENINFRNILAGKLRIENFDVEFATGGFHVLHMIERYNDEINMVIIHEDMSDMAAQEIISLIRHSKSKTSLPILFISKEGSEEDICDTIFIGANDYIVQTTNYKPIVERAQKYLQIFTKNAA